MELPDCVLWIVVDEPLTCATDVPVDPWPEVAPSWAGVNEVLPIGDGILGPTAGPRGTNTTRSTPAAISATEAIHHHKGVVDRLPKSRVPLVIA